MEFKGVVEILKSKIVGIFEKKDCCVKLKLKKKFLNEFFFFLWLMIFRFDDDYGVVGEKWKRKNR